MTGRGERSEAGLQEPAACRRLATPGRKHPQSQAPPGGRATRPVHQEGPKRHRSGSRETSVPLTVVTKPRRLSSNRVRWLVNVNQSRPLIGRAIDVALQA